MRGQNGDFDPSGHGCFAKGGVMFPVRAGFLI
jgi:hypothetical protein